MCFSSPASHNTEDKVLTLIHHHHHLHHPSERERERETAGEPRHRHDVSDFLWITSQLSALEHYEEFLVKHHSGFLFPTGYDSSSGKMMLIRFLWIEYNNIIYLTYSSIINISNLFVFLLSTCCSGVSPFNHRNVTFHPRWWDDKRETRLRKERALTL